MLPATAPAPPPALRIPLVRSATLRGYVELAGQVGLDGRAELRRAGLSLRSLDDPDTRIAAHAVVALLEHSAVDSGTEDFGLRLAAMRTFSHLGPLSLVLASEPTARLALHSLCRYLRLLNPALVTHIDEDDGMVSIREDLIGSRLQSCRQSTELAVGVMFRSLQELIGSGWKPVQVCFTHRPPAGPAAHRTFFGLRDILFNHEFSGIVCRAAELDLPRIASDPGIARFARQHLDQALSLDRQSMRDTVRQLVVALLPGGRCTVQQVATHLGVDRRTIHRRLAAESATFTGLLDESRRQLAQRQLHESDLPVAEIAALLGFSSASAFAHWFRHAFDATPGQWRRTRHRAA